MFKLAKTSEKPITLLTKYECKQILRKSVYIENPVVINFKLEPVKTDGFMGEYYNLLIEYRDGSKQKCAVAQKVYFVKTLPFINQLKTNVIVENGLFKKEADLYSQMFMNPEMSRINEKRKWSPSCFFAREDIIVIEDLKIKGFKVVAFPEKLGKMHIMEALKAIARMHASSILYERKQKKTIMDQFEKNLFEVFIAPDNRYFNTGLRAVKAVAMHESCYGIRSEHEDFVRDEFYEKVNRIYELMENQKTIIPKALCHRDLWRNNFMFRYNDRNMAEADCILLDFQNCRYLSITVDVIMCIFLNSSPKHRRKYTDEYLLCYFEQLKMEFQREGLEIDSIFSWLDFLASYEELQLLGLVCRAVYSTLADVSPTIFRKMNAKDELKYQYIMLENRDSFVLEHMQRDDMYRDSMIAKVEELVEFILKN